MATFWLGLLFVLGRIGFGLHLLPDMLDLAAVRFSENVTSFTQDIRFYLEANTNDSGLSFHLAWQEFHEIWMPDTWQGTGLPNRSAQGREWVRVMASQRRGQPRSKPEWVMGFLEMDGQPFYSRKDHHPLCWQAYTKQEFVFQ